MTDYTDKTCSECCHWHKQPIDPNDVSQKLGQCRQGPPVAIAIPIQSPLGIQVQVQFQHRTLPGNFPACAGFEAPAPKIAA